MEVSLLEVVDPSCFWVAIERCGSDLVNEIYENLNAEMNQFYDRSCQDVNGVKPLAVEEGQICVVFSEELKCWCRAVIKSVIYCTDHYQTECFLVDYAKYVFVKPKNIRVALEAFMKIPYRAKKCRLYRTKPVTLHIDWCKITAKTVPAKRWDSAATLCFQKLLKATTEVKATLCAIEDNIHDVFLYVKVRDEKVCINDYLVTKKFARYEEDEENTENSADCWENQTSLNMESLPDKWLAFRPVLPQETVSANLEAGLTLSSSFPEKTYQSSSTDLNESTASIDKAVPVLPFKENAVVHTDRFQQSLNSYPLKSHMIENDQKSFKNDSGERNLVFLSNKIEPFSTLETAPLFDDLKKELTRKKVLHPGFTASYCWTPVARGCDVVTISCEGSDPLLYIPPVLTFLQSGNCYTALPNKYGPLALILCPGWKKAQLVFEQLKIYGRCSRQLHPMLIILGQKKEDAKRVRIRGCDVLVTTPHSFLRLFEHHSLLFCRLCHLILDEVDVLFCSATEQVFSILDCYKKAFFPEILEYSPHQIIAVGTHWNKHITHLIKEFMNDPYIVITAMEEASIYGNVHQVVQLCMNSDRIAVLLKILDFNHSNIQKMLVFTNSVDEAEMVHKALKSESVVALKIHKESLSNLKYILEQWTKKHSSGTQVVLVLTDDCMQALGITDATCVVHFSFPSPRIFGQRLHTMSDNFCNLIKDSSVGQEYMKAKSVILLTENSERDALGMLYYMQHAEAEIPPELHDLTAKMLEAEEDKKCSRPLCTYLKTFGICKNRKVCPDRHRINSQTDLCQNIPAIRTSGYVTILPLHIVNATNYFGRIVDKQKDQYTILAEEINDYFKKPSNKISVKNVEKLAIYGLCEKTFFHRVQVVEILAKEEGNLFFSVKVKYIDEGRTSRVQNHHLLHLPAEFQCLPPQAVEFIVCRVKPIDDEIEWNPEVTHFINQKIKGKVHEAKIVHTLGNTVWVDPMVRVTRISDLKMSVNEYNVRSEILSTGLATDNAEHITQLQKLCRRAEVSDNAKNLEPLRMKEDISVPENLSNLQNMSSQEHFTENCNSSAVTLGNHLCDVASHLPHPSMAYNISSDLGLHRSESKQEPFCIPTLDGVAQTKISEETTLHQHKCFYPQIKWFQNEETVTVKVNVASVADCNCEFSKEKVIFRACSGDKLYLADMDLHHCILPEKSTYVIKDKEAVIVLMKEKKEAWSKLLKNKNLHVSLDFEHWEAFEDKSPFPDGAKTRHHTTAKIEDLDDSSGNSETESD